MMYKPHTNCRICKSNKLIPYLDLGYMPLSNNLAHSINDPIHDERYPLKVLFCKECGLSQLSIVIQPEAMFTNYVYRSSISQGYVDHCKQMAIELKQSFHLHENSNHIDIAGNDGALIEQFKNVIGCNSLNVDPAQNLAAICYTAGIKVYSEFWNLETARKILNGGLLKRGTSKSSDVPEDSRADIITATNVFAHVDDVEEFLFACKIVLKPSGKIILEFPYLINFIEGKEFDTVYFEHLSYFSIYPLTLLCKKTGLEVLNVTRHDIHGGSVRVIIGNGLPDDTVSEFVKAETDYRKIEPYYEFAEDIQLTIMKFRLGVMSLTNVAGFAASAKGNTLLNSAGITLANMKFIVDETPEKIGKYSPGTRIPIISITNMMRRPPDYLVILSWNFQDEIINKCRQAGYKGKFIIPIPEFKIIE